MKSVFVILFSFFIGTVIAAPNELAQIKSQIKRAEIQDKKLSEQVKSSLREIENTKEKLVKTADKVSVLESQRGAVINTIYKLDSRRDVLTKSLSENHEKIATAAADILFISSTPSFDSENMRDFILTASIISAAAAGFDAEINDATIKITELEKNLDTRVIEKEKLDRSAKKYAEEKSNLDKLLRNRAGQNEKLKAQQYDLQKKLRDLSARAKSISELSAGVGSSEMSSDAKFSRKKLNAPVRGNLVSRFGEKTGMGMETDGWRIRVSGDALVSAPADGVVKFADSFKGFGRIVILSHKNGYNTVLTNMGDLYVLLGQEVLSGEPLGRMDKNKYEMYLEVRRGSKAVDPARLFNEP